MPPTTPTCRHDMLGAFTRIQLRLQQPPTSRNDSLGAFLQSSTPETVPTTPTCHFDTLGAFFQSPPPTTEPTPPTSHYDSLGAFTDVPTRLRRRERAQTTRFASFGPLVSFFFILFEFFITTDHPTFILKLQMYL